MEDHLIQIRLSECKALLLRNWDLLSEETKQRLRDIGIDPDAALVPAHPDSPDSE